MSLLKNIFNKEPQQEEKPLPWILVEKMSQLDDMVRESEENLVAIFKHSTRCGVSRMALRRFEKDFDHDLENVKIYFLDLLAHRDISNEIAARFQVIHESPQLILLKKGKTVAHYSHSDVRPESLNQFV